MQFGKKKKKKVKPMSQNETFSQQYRIYAGSE